jgi:TRAP-type mannitol/chloroaromatic compound transport system permease small subunit
MTDEPNQSRPTEEQEEERLLVEAARKASRFSREFLATVISLLTTAFGVVVALAWNTALSKALGELSSAQAKITGLFIYAVVITGIAVLVIVFLGRLATRIGAQPVEFKYPAKPAKE